MSRELSWRELFEHWMDGPALAVRFDWAATRFRYDDQFAGVPIGDLPTGLLTWEQAQPYLNTTVDEVIPDVTVWTAKQVLWVEGDNQVGYSVSSKPIFPHDDFLVLDLQTQPGRRGAWGYVLAIQHFNVDEARRVLAILDRIEGNLDK